MHAAASTHIANGLHEMEAYGLAADAVISRQIASTALPRRFTQMSREIWQLQSRFDKRQGKRAERLTQHPQFRAAYDFLLLRAASGENVGELAEWWTKFQEGKPVAAPTADEPAPRRRRRRRRGRRRGGAGPAQ